MSAVELLKLLYIFSFNLGVWANMSTLINRQCPRETKRILFLFISILLVMPLNGYLSLALETPPELLGALASTLTWTYGPLAYLLVNNLIKTVDKTLYLPLHFIPFVVVTGLYMFSYEWLSFYYYQGALILQLATYLSLSFYNLFAYRKKIALIGREFKNTTYYWMLYLIAGLFAIVIYENTLVLMLHQGVKIDFVFVATTVGGFSIYISTIAIFLLFQPGIFESKEEGTSPQCSNSAPEAQVDKSRNIELSPDVASELATQLEQLMMREKPYLENDICLSMLADRLGISTHHLSELLNFHLQTNFYDFLNMFRFTEALALISSHKKQYSVMDIAYLSGFNNRNTFYRVFKENTGLTPGEYRKQVRNTNNVAITPQESQS